MVRTWAAAFVAVGLGAGGAQAALPTFDKIVVVIEENESLNAVLGSGMAPYMDSLAAGGVTFSNMYGLTHPSQPNYLQLFSGSNQGVDSNVLVAAAPLSSPNLGAAVIAAGGTLAGFSESMPSEGYLGWDAEDGLYARRHNPWVNWQSATPGPNQLAPSVNLPFSAFPSDYSQLPRVSIVVPNNAHNSHDTTIGDMDAWLAANMSGYAEWALSHNSLLVVTFDEDDFASRNHIPEVFYGAHVAAGATVRSTWTPHNLLRTLSELTGAAPPGAGAQVRPIVGAFLDDPLAKTVSFRQGSGGYAGATDTKLDSELPGTVLGGVGSLEADGSPRAQSLLKFEDLVGAGAGQVPTGATILSAKLLMHTTNAAFDVASTMALHPMLIDWSETDTWSSLASGVSIDGVEAATTADFTVLPNIEDAYAIFDVSDRVQAWVNGATNRGWVVEAAGLDGWWFDSSEAMSAEDRPVLEVTYLVREWAADFDADGSVTSADLTAWTAAMGGGAAADADGDGDSDGRDFLAWQRQLGSGAGAGMASGAEHAVPEPGTLAVAGICAAGMQRRRRLI